MQNVHPSTINYGPSVTVYYKQFMTNNCAVVGEPLVPLNREVPVAAGAGVYLRHPPNVHESGPFLVYRCILYADLYLCRRQIIDR